MYFFFSFIYIDMIRFEFMTVIHQLIYFHLLMACRFLNCMSHFFLLFLKNLFEGNFSSSNKFFFFNFFLFFSLYMCYTYPSNILTQAGIYVSSFFLFFLSIQQLRSFLDSAQCYMSRHLILHWFLASGHNYSFFPH